MNRVISIRNKLGGILGFEAMGKYYQNISWLFIDRIARMASGIFLGVWLARYLGPNQFGTYNYVQNFAGMVGILATLGLDRIVVKELLDKNLDRNEVLGTAFLMKLCAAIITVILLCVLVGIIENTTRDRYLILIVGACQLAGALNVIDFLFQSLVASRYVVISNLVCLFASISITITMIVTNQPLEYFVYLLLFNSIALGFLLVLIYEAKVGSIIKWKFNARIMMRLLQQGWPLILTSSFVIFQMKIDQVMLRLILGVSDVGLYAAAVKISEASYFLPMIIMSSLWPAIVKWKNLDEKMYLKKLQKLYRFMAALALVLALTLSLLANSIVFYLFGDAYSEAADILRIHVWSSVFVYLGVASGAYLINEGLQRKNFYRAAVGVAVNVPLNLLLIPRFGCEGAAISTCLSFMVSNYLYDILDTDLRCQFIMKTKSILLFNIPSWQKAR